MLSLLIFVPDNLLIKPDNKVRRRTASLSGYRFKFEDSSLILLRILSTNSFERLNGFSFVLSLTSVGNCGAP